MVRIAYGATAAALALLAIFRWDHGRPLGLAVVLAALVAVSVMTGRRSTRRRNADSGSQPVLFAVEMLCAIGVVIGVLAGWMSVSGLIPIAVVVIGMGLWRKHRSASLR
jgi:uncharacterized membrane protein YfcA